MRGLYPVSQRGAGASLSSSNASLEVGATTQVLPGPGVCPGWLAWTTCAEMRCNLGVTDKALQGETQLSELTQNPALAGI